VFLSYFLFNEMGLLSNKKILLYTRFLIKHYYKQSKSKQNKMKKGTSPARKAPPCQNLVRNGLLL
ncbi:hypothetical protein ACS78_28265, partial [Priestia megaterium]